MFGIEVCDLFLEILKGFVLLIVVVMNDIEWVMVKLGYVLYSGEMFKRVKNFEYIY